MSAGKRSRRRRPGPTPAAAKPSIEGKAPTRTRPARLTRRQLLLLGIAAIALVPVQYFILERVLERPPGQSIAEVKESVLESVNSPHVPYSSIPPTSGPHVKDVAPWGMHEEPIPNEVQVANLAAGGVIIQYNCVRGTEECEELVRRLEQVYEQRYAGKTVLIAPGPAVADARIALTAWTRLLKLEGFREIAVTEFTDAFLKKPIKP